LPLQLLVAEKLALDWSPEQISGWLRRELRDQPHMRVSHETIYKTLFIQARGVLKSELRDHLRSGRRARRSCKAATAGQQRGQIVGGASIRERPHEVENRTLPGHWEGDLLTGTNVSHIATLVERHSRFTMLVKVGGKDTSSVVSAVARQVGTLPPELRKSLTWDRGTEMAAHRQFTAATNLKVYFCDPQSPWQRGTNENTNRLLRQYFPKGTSLAAFSQRDLDAVALRLNERPRKTLGFETPAGRLEQFVAATG
jgi:IS30 family transposase